MRFLLSTPSDPYVPRRLDAKTTSPPRGPRPGRRRGDRLGEPGARRDRPQPVLGIAGHSLGAGAISTVQQCATRRALARGRRLPRDAPFPIRAVVGWDSLSAGDDVVPVVPGMNQQADGYFLNPTPTPTAPDPRDHLARHDGSSPPASTPTRSRCGAAPTSSGATSRYILPATSYGIDTAGYYTLAWFDRYVHRRPRPRRQAATDALLDGPDPRRHDRRSRRVGRGGRTSCSARYLSAFSFHGADGARHEAIDLRAYAGLSPVGDWAGANADSAGASVARSPAEAQASTGVRAVAGAWRTSVSSSTFVQQANSSGHAVRVLEVHRADEHVAVVGGRVVVGLVAAVERVGVVDDLRHLDALVDAASGGTRRSARAARRRRGGSSCRWRSRR